MAVVAVTIEQIAAFTKGTRIGAPDLVISGVSGIHEAGPGDLSFIADPAAVKDGLSTRASALLVPRPIDLLACAQI
ncbi:MAG: LpxD N-terminal domain-containing protein, partial [Nitrospirales bacterium]|nr:LpxD N-terminal domain-containing protein [Nitrospirales bacterium]